MLSQKGHRIKHRDYHLNTGKRLLNQFKFVQLDNVDGDPNYIPRSMTEHVLETEGVIPLNMFGMNGDTSDWTD